MRPRRNLVYLLSLGLLLLAMAATYGCGGSNNSLFPGGSAAQGDWSGTGGGSGTTSGGTAETWDLTIDHTANTFSAQDVTTGKNYSGSISVPPSLFLENVTTTSNDSSLTLPATGHSIEVPDTFIILHLDDASSDVTPLVNTKGQCPTLSGPTTFNSIRYGWKNSWDSTTDVAYEITPVTQSGSTFTGNNPTHFKLDGTSGGPSTGGSFTCSNGVFTPGTPGDSGLAFSPTELIGLSGPSAQVDHSEVIFPDPGVSISAVVAGQYVGMVFNSTLGVKKVGFGPGPGSTSISGGTFANIKTNAFNTHANNITINFSPGPSAGLLTGSVVDVNGTHSPMIAMVTTTAVNGGKFQILLLTTDTSSTQPYHIFLSQK